MNLEVILAVKSKTLFEHMLKEIPKNERIYLQKCGDIAMQIAAYMKQEGVSQKQLAQKLNMKESRLSKVLSGSANLSLKTITQFEAYFGKDIISTPLYAQTHS